MHLKPTPGCQISTLIFEKQLWRGGLYKYPMKNISRTAKFLHDPGNTFNVNPKWKRTLASLLYFSWDIYRGPTLHNLFSNIKVDILNPAVGLRCIIRPRHLS
jgi:hypothetical protein